MGSPVLPHRSAAPARSAPAVPGWVVVSAAVSPVLIAAAWLLADALQPVSYSPVRQTVSVLAGYGGTHRWIVTSALFVVGGCELLTAAGLAGVRAFARLLLVVAGLASVGIAACPEPAHGSTPAHLAWTALGAVVIAVWPAFTARPGASSPVILSARGCAAVTAVFVALLGWLAIETQNGSLLGLAERLCSLIQTSWPFVVALVLWRATSRAGGPEPAGERPPATVLATLAAGRSPGPQPPAGDEAG